MSANIQFKRGTAATFHSLNPVLLRGEPGLEIDTNKIKYGNGVTPWRDLPYANPALEVVDGGTIVAPAVPAVPGIFTPPTLDGLVLWLDADDADYTHKVNNRVSLWEDLSDTRAQFFQSNKANRPVTLNKIGQEDVVTFDGVNDAMIGNFELPAEFTMLIALRRRGNSTNGKVVTAYSQTGAAQLVLCGTETGGSLGVGTGTTYSATQPVDDLVPVVYTLQFTSDGFSTRLNGLNTTAGTLSSAAAKTVMALGGDRADFSADNFSGDIAEIVMYDRILTAPELLDVETYMMERRGISQVVHPLLTGMKAFWPLNEESGNRIDITDSEVPLTPTGTVGFEAGVIGNAANFTGGANYLQAPADFTLSGAFSVSLWFKPDAVTGSAPQIIQNWAGGMQGQLVIGFGDEGMETSALWAYVRTSDNNYRVSALDLVANRWYHVALVFDQTGNKLLLYVDGVLADQAITAGTLATSTIPLRVGVGEQTTVPNTVACLVDQLGIWDRVLSAVDVEMLYNDELGKEDFTADLYGDNVSLLLHMDKPANAVGGSGGGNADPYFNDVSLLLHMNGPGFTDSSANAVAVSATNAVISSAQSKFGGASGEFGVGRYLTTPSNANFNFGTGAFTIELWIRTNSFTTSDAEGTTACYIGKAGDDGGPDSVGIWTFETTPTNLVLYLGGPGSVVGVGGEHGMSTGTWYHVAVARESSGDTRMFVNGAQIGTTVNVPDNLDNNYEVTIGGRLLTSRGGDGRIRSVDGYIDDLRVTKGVARYTANFTPPTAEFPDNSALIDPYFDNVALLLRMDSTTFTDVSPLAHNVVAVGNATVSTTQSKFGGGSLALDGSGDWLVVQNAADIAYGNNDFTIECWLYLTAYSNGAGLLLGHRPSTYVYGGTSFNITSTGAITMAGTSNAAGNNWQFPATDHDFGVTIPLNAWKHVALVRAGNTVTLYVDGVAAPNTTTLSEGIFVGPEVAIGSGWTDLPGGQELTGYIDEVRITLGVARYTANFDPPTAEFPLGPIKTVTMPPVETALLLHMDGANASTTFFDSGENAFTFTANNTAAISTLQSKFGGSSLILDGTYGFLSAPHNNKLTFDGDFTVELFAYFNDTPTELVDIFSFCGVWDRNPNYSWLFACVPEGLRLYRSDNGQTGDAATVAWTPSVGEWYHIAVCQSDQKLTLPWSAGKFYQGGDIVFYAGQYWRAWFGNSAVSPPGFDEWQQLSDDFSSTAKLRFFVNGAQIGSDITMSAVYKQSSAPLTIGAAGFDGHHFPGYIDEVRITKGAALYGANFTPPTAPFADPQPTPDLLITFDDGIEDLSANAHTITNNNVSTGLPTAPSAGFGNAGVFNGTNSYLVIPDAPEFDLSSGPFCIELRFIVTAPGQDINTDAKVLIAKDQYGVSYSWGIGIAAEAIRVATANIAGDWEFLVTQIISSNEWHHIALTGDGSTMKLFYDGVLVGTKNRTLTNAAASVTIGCGSFNNPAGHFPGYIDNVRIVKGDQVYTANFAPPTASLTLPVSTPAPDLLLHFDGPTFVDHGKNQLTPVVVGDAALSTTQSKFGGSSVYFDGIGDFLKFESGPWGGWNDSDWTIEFWIWPASVTGYAPLFLCNASLNLHLYNTGDLYLNNATTGTGGLIVSNALVIEQWQHVAVVRRDGISYLYVNGVVQGSEPVPYSNGPGTTLAIGGENTQSAYFNGYIDELRVVKGHAIYTANFTPPTAPFQNPIITITQPATGLANGLEAFWKFDDLTDSTGNGYNLVDVGYSTITPGKIGGALTVNTNNGLQYAKISNFRVMRAAGFSISCWIKSDNLSETDTPSITQGIPFGFCSGAAIVLAPSQFIAGNNICPGNLSEVIKIFHPAGGASGMDGNWHHCVGTFDGSTANFYLDGVLIGTQTGVTLSDSWITPDVYFGSGMAEYARTGQVDSAGYWTRALTESEVLALYNNGNGTETLTGGGGGAGPITTFIDSSKHNHELTAVGNAYLNLTDIKYGSGSGEFAGGHCTIPMSPEFAFGTGDFTVEFWGNLNYAADSAVFSIAPESEEAGTYLIGFRNDPNLFGFCYDIPNFTFVSADISAYYGEWAHYAFVRLDGVLKMYVNGTQVGTANTTIDLDGGTQTTAVIGRRWVDVDDHYLAGLIDDLRITKGAARYIANFNPPTKAFPDPVLVAPPAPAGDIYAENVTLLLHMDGANGSTTFTDNSYLQNTVTAEGGAVVSTAQSKWGGASLDVTQAGRKLLVNSAPAASLGSGDFTIECWLYWTGQISGFYSWGAIAATATAPNPGGWYFLIDTNNNNGVSNALMWIDENSGFIPGNMSVPANEWCHVAVVRAGNNIRLYVNGIAAGSGTSTTDIVDAGPVAIGADNGEAGYVLGYIDDFRITKGVARYTADFIPPTEAFPNPFVPGVDATLLMHFDGAAGSPSIVDSSVNSFNVINNGAVISTAQSKFGGASGDFSGGAVTITSTPDFAFSGDFTIEGWFFFNNNNVGYQPLISTYINGDATGWALVLETNNTLNFYGSTGGYSWPLICSSTYVPTPGQWVHVAVTRSGQTVRLFADGVQIGTTTSSINVSGGTTVGVGYYQYFPDFPRALNGYIDELRIVKGTAVYTSNFTPPTAPFSPTAAVTPADITGCDLWLDSTGDIAESNGAILTWADKSGNGRTATPADYAPAPVVAVGAGPNGQDVVRFSGDPNVLDVSYQFNLKNSSGFILLGQTGQALVSGWQRVLGFQPVTGLDSQTADGMCVVVNNYISPYGLALFNDNTQHIAVTQTLPLPWTLISYTVSATGEIKFRVNGEEVDSSIAATIANKAGGNLYIGHGGALVTDESLQGDIAEIALFDHALGEAALIGLERGIMQRWFPAPTPPGLGSTALLLHLDSSFADSSPSNLSVTPVNTIISTAQSKFGGASAAFDGDGDWLEVADAPQLQFADQDFTIEAFVLFSAEPTSGEGAAILAKEIANTFVTPETASFEISVNTTPAVRVVLAADTFGAPGWFDHYFTIPGSTVSPGTWKHIAVCRHNNQVLCFWDGVLIGSEPYTYSVFPGTNLPVVIGARYLNNTSTTDMNFSGFIDELRIVKGTAVYTGNFTPPTQPFGAANLLMHFDADTSDNSGNNVSVTNNGVTIDTITTKFGSGSAYFNGLNVSTLTTPDLPAFGFGTGDFTIEMFVKQQSATRNSVLSIGTYQDGILWRLTPYVTDSLYLAYNAPGGNAWDWDATASVPIDTWAHIALTRQNGTLRAFIDGVMVFEQTGVTVDLGASRPLTIGCGAHELTPTDAYYGYIDELRIIKGEAVYTGNFTPPTAPFN